MTVQGGLLRFETQGNGEIVDLTEGVKSVVRTTGVERGLVIYKIGTHNVNSVKEVETLLSRATSGTSVDFSIGVVRANGAQRVETLTLTAR